MKDLVYFPTFEPSSEAWLKFALLYMEQFNPIIPNSRYNTLSPTYQRIMEAADLIEPYNPTSDQGERASIKAIEYLDKMRQQRHRYSALFNESNVIRLFQNEQDMNFEIYTEKFSYNWKRYCLENQLGIETNDGIRVHENLAFIYMTFLAEEIAFEHGKSIITDSNRFDHFLNFKQSTPSEARTRQKLAQSVISLAVPGNVSELTFAQLIKFRQRNRERIRAFNTELDNTMSSVENRITATDFIDRYNSIYSELNAEIIAQGVGIITIPLSAYLVISDPNTGMPGYLEKTLRSLGMVLAGNLALRGRWKEIATRHNCRKYLTNLNRLA